MIRFLDFNNEEMMLQLNSRLNGWVKRNIHLHRALNDSDRFLFMDHLGYIRVDLNLLHEHYKKVHLSGKIGSYADGFIGKLQDEIVEFLNECDCNRYKLSFRFIYGPIQFIKELSINSERS